jgi:signal transduction histidine kinase
LPEHLSLAYNNNYLTFGFVGITMNLSKKVKYQYTLEGMDKSWSASPAARKRPTATATGSYTFKVKAMNSEGYWSNEFKYPFVIRPPWWYSWWAYGFYLLTFCGVVLLVHRYQRARVIRKERERTQHKELEQAKEIKKAYDQLDVAHTNLKATQTQLIQSEKMASLGELTAGIAHEIQNPLNFVNNFSEVNSELVDELEQEVKKGNLDGVTVNCKRH